MINIIIITVFILSDIILLMNSLNIQAGLNFKPQNLISAKYIVFTAIYGFLSYTMIGFFHLDNKGIRLALFSLYAFMLWFIPITILKKINFFSFYVPLFICFLDSLFQSSVLCIINAFSNNTNSQILSKFSSFIFELLLFAALIYAKDKNWLESIQFALSKLSKFIYLLTLFCIIIFGGVISLFEYTALSTAKSINVLKVLSIILMIIMFIVLFALLINSMSKKYFEDTSKLLTKQINTQLAHYSSLKELRQEYHAFRHDYINHMHCLASLINADKKADALDYINNLSKAKVIFEKPYETGNDILDSILAEKAEYAKKFGIKIKAEGLFTMEFEPVDLCIIFSNALDNAVEACQKLRQDEEKVINVILNIRQNHQFISVSNPFDGGLHINKGRIISAKKDTEQHGFGLKNIKSAAERHDGMVEAFSENGKFYLNVVFKI